MTAINGWACFFLVTLRLAIGWHFLIEGMHKIQSHRVGKTATNTPWTSAGFFRGGNGPAAEWARQMLSLDDQSFQDQFADNRIREQLYSFKNSVEVHYRLSPAQSKDTRDILVNGVDRLAAWLQADDAMTMKQPYAWGSVELKTSIPKELENWKAKRQQAHDIVHLEAPAFNDEVAKSRLRQLQSEAMAIQNRLAEALAGTVAAIKTDYLKAVESTLTDEQKQMARFVETTPADRIRWVDLATMWTHTVLGGLLLAGLFSRFASFMLALFLLSVTLIAPAIPYWPQPPGSMGYYIFVNLYTIEMIALFALVFLPTGQWFGLDALVRRLQLRQTQ